MLTRRRLAAVLTPFVLTLSLLPGAATAATVSGEDPTGDGSWGRRLDIVSGTLHNRQQRIVVVGSFRRVVRGSFVAVLDARNRQGTVLIGSKHRRGPDRTIVANRSGTEIPCRGARSSWDLEARTARVSLPARCFRNGDYRAVRTRVVTERLGGGADVDLAFGQGFAWTGWARRG